MFKKRELLIILVTLLITITMGVSVSAASSKGYWKRTADGVGYVTSKGNFVKNKWKKIKSKKYYFDKTGTRVTGFKVIKGKKYYFSKKGVMKTGWLKKGECKYYFNKTGVMKTGWLNEEGKTYYFNSDGKMQKGLTEIDDKKYYFNENGIMQKGWQKLANQSYYFGEDGVMATSWTNISGKKYFFTNKGTLKKEWFKVNEQKYYADEETGEILIGIQKVGKHLYYFDHSGKLYTDRGRVLVGNFYYLVGENAKLKTGWYSNNGDRWYFDENGRQKINCWVTYKNKKYHLDKNGDMERYKWVDSLFIGSDGAVLTESLEKLQPKEGELTKGTLDEMDLSECTKLAVVAHPDDETLWGGGHLSEGGYLVVCMTNGYNRQRKEEFYNVMEKMGNKGIILSYPDIANGIRDDWSKVKENMLGDLELVMKYKKWGMVVTHNPNGEYGHMHHKMTNTLVTYCYNKLSWENRLFYFGKYYNKKTLPEVENTIPMLPDDNYYMKLNLLKLYISQPGAINDSIHMARYEDWKLAQYW